MTSLTRNESIAGSTVTWSHVQCLQSAACGLALLAALGAMSCATVGRESPETEEPLKFDLQCEVAADGGLQCVLTMENCGTRPVLVSRYVFVSAESEVLYPPGSRGMDVYVHVGTGHPFDPDEFVYLSPQEADSVGSPTTSVKFSLGPKMLLENDRYPAVLTVDGMVFVVALMGETHWQIENHENRSWEGTFTAHDVPFSVKVPLPKKPKTK